MKSQFRLTKAAKILLSLVLVVCVVLVAVIGLKTGFIKNSVNKEDNAVVAEGNNNESSSGGTASAAADDDGNIINTTKSNDAVFNVSLDEWIGYKSIIDANGGYTTAEGSIFDELGIQVNISIINDATQSSNAFIRGDLDAAGYTINRMAFLSSKFSSAGKEVIFPFITNYSNGGDGIIAKSDIQTIQDLVGKKIGVPQFSEAQTLVVWFVNNSDLSDSDKKSIIDNLIMFDTADETAKAFFAGQVDVAATWEPYLTQAQNMSNAHILFSTASSSNLILSGICVDKEYAEAHPDVVDKFIQGTLMAADMYTTEFSYIGKVMPMFSTMSEQDIIEMTYGAALTTWKDNDNLLKDTAPMVYQQMCDIWATIGETVDKDMASTLFDNTYVTDIAANFSATEVSNKNTVEVTEENTAQIVDTQALLGGTASVTFEKNTAIFTDSAAAAAELDKFIEIAKILDGAIIEIAGNTDPNPASDPDDTYNKSLSYDRANAVANYFIMNGIDARRIHVVGNGSSNPIVDNDSEEHRAMNRRTDVYFKILEQ